MTYIRIKIIRTECSKRWPGNSKVYFKNNNANSMLLSEMVLLLEQEVKIDEIGFGKSKLSDVTALCIPVISVCCYSLCFL